MVARASLVDVVQNAPEVEVRRRAFELLVDRDAADPDLQALFHETRNSDDPEIRVLSAKARRDADTLVMMALDTELFPQARRAALPALFLLDPERLVYVVSAIFEEQLPASETELALLRREDLAILNHLPSAPSEALAIGSLDDPEPQIRQTAIAVLSVIGSALAVPPLKAIRGELNTAANQVILTIQQRIGAHTCGWLDGRRRWRRFGGRPRALTDTK